MTESPAPANYRSLSSVAQALLPRAERMHTQGMTWRQIAEELKVSYTALHIWRKLREARENPSLGLRETQLEPGQATLPQIHNPGNEEPDLVRKVRKRDMDKEVTA